MKALQILKRRMRLLFHGKGQVSLEWMLIAAAVIVLAMILFNAISSMAPGIQDEINETGVFVTNSLKCARGICP